MKILVVEPKTAPYVKEVSNSLEELQSIVGGDLQVIYPFNDDVALVCNESGKLLKLVTNRVLIGIDGDPFDVIVGTFFIVGLGIDDFEDLPEELVEKYSKIFSEYFAEIYKSN
jgi:hypothetical protein